MPSLKSCICLVSMVLAGLGSLDTGHADQTALVLIDMQPYYVVRTRQHAWLHNRIKLTSVLARQLELVASAKTHRRPIVVVEHEAHAPTHAELLRGIGDYALAITVHKCHNDVFCAHGRAAETLRRFLDEQCVNELVVAGANGSACVRESIEGALEQGYRVWADTCGIIEFKHGPFEHPYRIDVDRIRIDTALLGLRFDQGDALPRFAPGHAGWDEGPPCKIEGVRIHQDAWARAGSCREGLERIDPFGHVELLSELMDATSFDLMMEEAQRREDERS